MTAATSIRRVKVSRIMGAVLLVLYLGFAAAIILWPSRIDGDSMGVYRLLYDLYGRGMPRWITYDVVQFAANIAFAAPIGLFLAMMLPRRLWWVSALACAALFGAGEAAQLFVPARMPSLLDWAANSLGGFAGALCWRLVSGRREGPRLY